LEYANRIYLLQAVPARFQRDAFIYMVMHIVLLTE